MFASATSIRVANKTVKQTNCEFCPKRGKGCANKNLVLNFCFAYISASIDCIFKILVPTPHNIPLIMWGRDKNYKNPMYRS